MADNIVTEGPLSSLNYLVETRSVIGSRAEQEDYGYLHVNKGGLFAVLCDGMGGLANGALASKVAAMSMRDSYADYLVDGTTDSSQLLYRAMVCADRTVATQFAGGAGTTLVAIAISGCGMNWVSVGDSRLYIMRSGELLQVTRDHNYRLRLDEMLQLGKISPEKYALEMNRGNALISYIGKGSVDLFDLTQNEFVLESHDIILLATDGLSNMLAWDDLSNILGLPLPLAQKADLLIRSVIGKGDVGTQDNTSFIIVEAL